MAKNYKRNDSNLKVRAKLWDYFIKTSPKPKTFDSVFSEMDSRFNYAMELAKLIDGDVKIDKMKRDLEDAQEKLSQTRWKFFKG